MAQCSPQEIFLTSNILKILQLKYCDELIGTNIVKKDSEYCDIYAD